MHTSEQIRTIMNTFTRIAEAKGNDKLPLVSATEGTMAGRALLLLLDKAFVFHIGRKALVKPINLLPSQNFVSLFEVCDYLSTRDGVTDQDIADVQAFISSLDEDLKTFVIEFLQKTLRLGVTLKSVQKAYKNPPPGRFECMFAKKFLENQHLVIGKRFALTEKLDGFRCVAVCRPFETPLLFSRQGKRITGFASIESDLGNVCARMGTAFMVDGELLIRDRTGIPSKEQYKRTSKIVSGGRTNKTGIVFNIFDIVTGDELALREGSIPYGDRRIMLERNFSGLKSVVPVPLLYVGDDTSKIWEHLDNQRALQHEGVMINIMDAPYVFGRTSHLLKVKVMQDADLRVIGLKEGVGKFKDTLGALVVSWKNTPVGVGSGLTNTMRETIWKNPDSYIGRIAKVRYFEETVNKDGVPSIRFPVFECFREEGKTVSYE